LPFPIDFEGRPYNIHTIVWGVISTYFRLQEYRCRSNNSKTLHKWCS